MWTRPLRPLTPETSLGFEACAFARDVLGLSLLPWQEWLLQHALEVRPDGEFRFRTVVVLVARQNGKTTLVQVLALWRLFLDRANLVIGTAQNLDLAEEAWTGCVDMVEGVPELAAEVEAVDRTNGKKALRLTGGARYKVQAANRRGGRGLSGDLVLLDELREHQSWDAWGAVTKTTLARPRAQVWCYSNAGDMRSVVLNHLVTQGRRAVEAPHESLDDSLGLFEWSAPDGCDPDDRAAWAQANPSLGFTITEDAIASARATDPEPVFRTEVLCQSVDAMDLWATTLQASWPGCADDRSELAQPLAFGLEVSLDRRRAFVGVSGRRADGVAHVEIGREFRGTADVEAEVAAMVARNNLPVVIDPGSPAGSWVAPLRERGVNVVTPAPREIAAACGRLYDAVTQGQRVRHRGQQVLNDAVGVATRRATSDAWRWGRVEGEDVAALYAATLAYLVLEGADPLDNIW